MSFKIILTPNFKKEAKRLAKKYQSLKSDLETLFSELEKDPACGAFMGNDVYKIRLAIASKGKGKRGGARVITYVQLDDETVLLLSIYDKGEQESISYREIRQILSQYLDGYK